MNFFSSCSVPKEKTPDLSSKTGFTRGRLVSYLLKHGRYEEIGVFRLKYFLIISSYTRATCK